MNKYKVNDRVYYQCKKGRIVGYKLGSTNPIISVNGSWCYVSHNDIKPIVRVSGVLS